MTGFSPPSVSHRRDTLIDSARSVLRAFGAGKWFAVNASRWHVANWGILGDDATDNTAAWVAMLQAIATAGGAARIVFGEGAYRIGAHMPAVGLHAISIEGAGAEFTSIKALPGSTDAQSPSTETGVYATTPLRFNGLDRLLVKDLTVDGAPLADWAVARPYTSLLAQPTPPTSTLTVWDSSKAPAGSTLAFGVVESESSASYEYVGVSGTPDGTTLTLSNPLSHAYTLTTDNAIFGVSKDVSIGGFGMDVRNIGRLTVDGVTVKNTFRGGIHHDTIPYVEIYDSHIEQVGMRGGFGHTAEYPFASQFDGPIGGYNVSKFLMDRCVLEESSNHAVMLRVKPTAVDFGVIPIPTYDIRVSNSLVLGHGTYTYVKGNGSGINILGARSDVTMGRVSITNVHFDDIVDGPIWIVAPDGHVTISDCQIDNSYGPGIALNAPLFSVTDNTIRGQGAEGIFVFATARTGDYVDRFGVDVYDGDISGNKVLDSGRGGIRIGDGATGRPPKSMRRIILANNIVTGSGLEGIFCEEIEGVVSLANNTVRNSNRLYTATMTLVTVPTTPDGPTTGPWTTITVAAPIPKTVEGNYFRFSADGGSASYRIVKVDRTLNKVTLDATPPSAYTGTLIAKFPSKAAVYVKGRRPFSTTITASTSGTPATVTVASIGDDSVGFGIGQYDRLTFGSNTVVYQVVSLAGSVLTLDQAWDAGTTHTNGTTVTLANVYPAREVKISGGFIGDAEDVAVGSKVGVLLERTGGLVSVKGVEIARVREAAVDILDATPRNGTVASEVEGCTFANIGQDTAATATRRAAVYIKSSDAVATNAGWNILGNRLVDDQAAPTAQYGLVLDGSGVGGGRAERNDWSPAQTKGWEVLNSGTFLNWDRSDNLHPWFAPNNDDLDLLEEFAAGSVSTSGQIGTHGLQSAGTLGQITPAAGLTGVRSISNSGATLGFVSIGNAAAKLVDAAEGWDWAGYFVCSFADGQYRAGMLDDPSLDVNLYGAYFERLITDANWMLVTNNNTTKTRVDTGVAFGSTGNYWTARIRRTLVAATPTVEWSIARVYGSVADRKGRGTVTTNLPPAGQALCAAALQVYDGAGGAANKSGRVDRLRFRVHGVARG